MGRLRTIAVSSLIALGMATSASAATEVTFSTSLAANNFLTLNMKQFIADAEKLSEGNLKIKFFADGVLYKRAIHRRVLQEGQVDLAEIDFSQHGNEDPMYVLIATPGLVNSVAELKTLWEVQKPYFDKRFAADGMRILYAGHWPGQGFYTKKPANALSDIKGLKLRVSNTQSKRMGDMLGYTATILPSAEVPQALATGLIDALFTSAQTGVDTQAWDHLKHFGLAVVGSATSAVAVNEAKFRKLDKKSQDALIEAGRLAYARSFSIITEADASEMKKLEQNGMKAGKVAQPIADELVKIGKVMVDEWRKEANPEANKILDAFFAATKK